MNLYPNQTFEIQKRMLKAIERDNSFCSRNSSARLPADFSEP